MAFPLLINFFKLIFLFIYLFFLQQQRNMSPIDLPKIFEVLIMKTKIAKDIPRYPKKFNSFLYIKEITAAVMLIKLRILLYFFFN